MPPIPPGCQILWDVFTEFHAARSSGGMGMSAITFQDMLAWQQIIGVTLNPWELDVIKALDQVALNAASEQQQKS